MMKELLEQKADLAIGDLTITYDREHVVDFTTPFMPLGESQRYEAVQQVPSRFYDFHKHIMKEVVKKYVILCE